MGFHSLFIDFQCSHPNKPLLENNDIMLPKFVRINQCSIPARADTLSATHNPDSNPGDRINLVFLYDFCEKSDLMNKLLMFYY